MGEIARRAGCSASILGEYERAERAPRDEQLVRDLAGVLDIPADELVADWRRTQTRRSDSKRRGASSVSPDKERATRRRRIFVATAAAVVTLLIGSLTFALSANSGNEAAEGAPSGQGAAPSIVASPTSALIDGQHVMVAGNGFTPSAKNVWVGECVNEPGPIVCDRDPRHEGFVPVDAKGRFSRSITVHETFQGATDANPDDRISIDCRLVDCIISAGQSHPRISARVPISFRTEPASPSVTVTPSKPLRDGQSVRVSGSGFAPNQQVFVLQCANGTIDGNSPCDVNGSAGPTTNEAGSFGPVSITIHQPLTSNVTTPTQQYDCAVVGCFVVAAQGMRPNQVYVIHNLSFRTTERPG